MTTPRYIHDSLQSGNWIRVFDLYPGLKHDPIDGHLRQIELPEPPEHAPEYTTLSYTWGSPKDPRFHILIDRRSFEVRENLLHALKALRHPREKVVLWIDAICINQNEVLEKNHQVGMMAKIYRSASHTKIWLGKSTLNSALGIECMNLLRFRRDGAHPSTSGNLSSEEEASLRIFFSRPYWYRVWILQEFLLSFSVEIHCGFASLSWTTLWHACEVLRSQLAQDMKNSPAFRLVDQRRALERGDYDLTSRTLESLIRSFASAKATDPRDRVFALLQLACDCTSGDSLTPDYGISRFRLLMKVLDFCRSSDSIGFANILLKALLKESEDDEWSRAITVWESLGTRQRTPMSERRRSYKVSIVFFVTLESSSGDSVRVSPSPLQAFLDLNFMQDANRELYAIILRLIKCANLDKGDRIWCIDEHNMVLLIDCIHVAIFSNSDLKVVVNPCRSLGFHAESETCTQHYCSLAWRILTLPNR